jgi:hypothetical protein
MTDVLIKKGNLNTETHTQEESHEGRDECDMPVNQRILKIDNINHQKLQERSGIGPGLEPPEGGGSADTLISVL